MTPLARLDPRFSDEVYPRLSTWRKMSSSGRASCQNCCSTFQAHRAVLDNQLTIQFQWEQTPDYRFLEQEMPRRFAFTMKVFFTIYGQMALYDGSCNFARYNVLLDENATTLGVDSISNTNYGDRLCCLSYPVAPLVE
jgi:hypothetical protein